MFFKDEAILVFSQLVLQGKIQEAVCFLTNRSVSGGILKPNTMLAREKQ